MAATKNVAPSALPTQADLAAALLANLGVSQPKQGAATDWLVDGLKKPVNGAARLAAAATVAFTNAGHSFGLERQVQEARQHAELRDMAAAAAARILALQ